MSKDNGGPAFPFEYQNNTSRPQKSFLTENMVSCGGAEQYAGMTIRDYFADSAMQGICVNAGRNGLAFAKPDEIAEQAYAIADAMIAGRSKQ